MDAEEEQAQLERVTVRLSSRFHQLSAAAVAAAVHAAEADLQAAAIRDFIPLLVEKEARDRLEARLRQGPAVDVA